MCRMWRAGDMKKFFVIAYDIERNKKRREVCKLLESHGRRVNRSVFECFITQKQLEDVKEKIGAMVKPREDCVLYYEICKSCLDKADRQGAAAAPREVVKCF